MRLTVNENLSVAAADTSVAFELFPELERLQHRKAGLLSGGEQQMLALARALARRPTLLMADELSFGLGPIVVKRLLEAVRVAADTAGLGVLIVEQHVRNVLKYADRVYVMGRGHVAMTGTAQEMAERMDEIEDSYLSDHAAERGGS
jgi:branched-chain amino acid transport system ATP-binding protein